MGTGERIRSARKKMGMTQKQLGQACGIDEANIRKYETDRQNPKLETLQKIADALDVPWMTLIAGKEDETMTQEKARTLYRAGGLRLWEIGNRYRVSDEQDGVETLLFETGNPAVAVSSFCGTVEARIRRAMIARMGKAAFYRWDSEGDHE